MKNNNEMKFLPVQVNVAKSGYFPLTALQAISLRQVDVSKYLPYEHAIHYVFLGP